jgi:hypothetical protein
MYDLKTRFSTAADLLCEVHFLLSSVHSIVRYKVRPEPGIATRSGTLDFILVDNPRTGHSPVCMYVSSRVTPKLSVIF